MLSLGNVSDGAQPAPEFLMEVKILDSGKIMSSSKLYSSYNIPRIRETVSEEEWIKYVMTIGQEQYQEVLMATWT